MTIPFLQNEMQFSCRWLAVNNQKDKAEEVLLEIARVNGRKVTQKQKEELRGILDK